MKNKACPDNLLMEDYDYILPEELIADFPAARRDASRLLLHNKGVISKEQFSNLPYLLPTDSLLVFNDTKVIPARLFFYTVTGKKIEIFCLSPAGNTSLEEAAVQTQKCVWNCLVGGAKKWKTENLTLETSTQEKITVTKKGRSGSEFLIEFNWNPGHLTFFEVLEIAGKVPLPPYIKRNSEPEDKKRYQTVFAQIQGSVAAPTAALHFTPEVLSALTKKNIPHHTLTLHVSAGTFKPVKSNNLAEHEMHAEYFEVNHTLINTLIQHPEKRVIPVGTTSMRTLESLYLAGEKLLNNEPPKDNMFQIEQWDGYNSKRPNKAQCLKALQEWMNAHNTSKITGSTRLMIAPGVKLNISGGLITNFHQPKSTLLLLVAALVGDDYKKAYNFAIKEKFRFLSYGDSCLFLP